MYRNYAITFNRYTSLFWGAKSCGRISPCETLTLRLPAARHHGVVRRAFAEDQASRSQGGFLHQ